MVRLRDRHDDITYDQHGNKQTRPCYDDVDVLPEADVGRLPDGRAVVIRRNAKPTVVRVEKYWNRADYKAWKRGGETIYIPAAPVRTIPTPRPDLAAHHPTAPPVPPPRDDLAARRAARRTPAQAPPLPDRAPSAPPVDDDQGEARTGTDQAPAAQPWRPWHGPRTGGES